MILAWLLKYNTDPKEGLYSNMTHKERKEEVREILALDTDELVKRAKGQLILFPTLDEVYDYLAEEMVKEFAKAAKGKKIVNFIMPVGMSMWMTKRTS